MFALRSLASKGIFLNDSLPFFKEKLADRFDKVVYNAAFAIGHLAEHGKYEEMMLIPLASLLHDKNQIVRQSSTFAL